MKKILLIGGLLLLLTGCNYEPTDLTYSYNKAVCNYDGDKFELHIDGWKDYTDGEQIQVKSDGEVYLISANKCYFIKEG